MGESAFKRSLHLLICSSNGKGIAITENKNDVYSLEFFRFKHQMYLGVSGDGGHFQAFDVSHLETSTTLSNSGLPLF